MFSFLSVTAIFSFYENENVRAYVGSRLKKKHCYLGISISIKMFKNAGNFQIVNLKMLRYSWIVAMQKLKDKKKSFVIIKAK